MWIFTKYGFYSAVCARTNEHIDTNQVLVRSRNRRHLENLKTKFALDCTIHESENTDYAYRMSLPKTQWAQILSELATEQDYTNFKNEASKNVQQTSSVYVHALHKVWSIMLGTQVR